MANDAKIPDIIREYLLYKGYSASLKAFDNDLKNDKDKGYRVDKIMEQLHMYINNHDIQNLKEFWSFLDSRLFSRLQYVYAPAVKRLESGLLKLYLVNCIQTNKQERVMEFFEKLGSELQGQSEWKEWFFIPFCRNPEENSVYAVYFSKQWQDTLFLSVQNLLSVIIQTLPFPKFMNVDEEVRKIKRLQEENKQLRKQISDLANNKQPQPLPQPLDSLDSILSPTGTLPGPSAMDLMDDFYVISQDTTVEDKPLVQKSQPIKTFIKSIGRSASPAPDVKKQTEERKAPVNTEVNSSTKAQGAIPKSVPPKQDSQYSRSKSEPGNALKQGNVKSKITGIPSTQGKTYKSDRPRSLDAQNPISPQSVSPSQTRPKDRKPEIVKKVQSTAVNNVVTQNYSSQSKESSQRSSTPKISYDNTDSKPKSLEINSAKSPFLLLSQEEYGEHRSPITHCRFSNTSHSVATLDADGVVKVWSLQPSPVTIATVMSKSMLLSLEWASKTDKYLLLGSKAGSVRLFDITNKKIEKEASVDQSCTRVSNLCCNPQGTQFICCSSGKLKQGASETQPALRIGKLTLWDLETMQCQKTLSLGQVPVTVNCACYSKSGQLLLTGSVDGQIRIFAPDSDKTDCIASWSGHQGEVFTVIFSVDESSCYSLGADGKLIEWSLTKFGEKLSDLPIHIGACGPFIRSEPGGFRQVQTPKGRLFALDSDGKHLLTCAQNCGLLYQLNSTNSMEPVMLISGHKTPVVTLDWTPSNDNLMCLTGSMDGKVQVSTLLNQ